IVKKLIEDTYPKVVAWRRDFHMYPEISGAEERTAEKIAEILGQLPIAVQHNVGGHGVVGVLRGSKPGKTIALRADIDALPIQEQNDFDFASRYKGKMHACGHDGHTAILLGAAVILSSLKDEIAGNIKFIFQPAEEQAPIGGAKPMIEDGVLENPHVDAILGLHIWPALPKGKVGIKNNALMASSDPFIIEIFGKNGHASSPHEAIDALVASCQIVNMLQTIVSRSINPQEAAVVTIGKMQSGTKYNVVADYAKLEGTVRTLDPKTQLMVEKRVREIVNGVCQATGTNAEINYSHGYPALINDKNMADIIREVGSKILPQEAMIEIDKPAMGGEDFANYLQRIPGAFFWLGSGQEDSNPIHHPKFDFDENIMKTGIEMLIHSAFQYLEKGTDHE
ncbi:MAG: carboxypeptidase, partial [Clostridia bacterium]|nr:carboxypeptidase [Clostridia bacterium]